MSLLDWLLLLVPLAIVLVIAAFTTRYVRCVTDFLSAGRSAGRYLVCMAEGMAGIGLISVVGIFEMNYQSGFALTHWGQLAMPISLVMALTGFIVYRYRQTRAMTMAQFFERRYSRRFRVFMGILAWFSGLINYGIFPAVSANFLIYYLGLPTTLSVAGWSCPTFPLLLALILGVALLLVLNGGQLQVLVTDCVQGLICGVFFLIIIVAILRQFSFDQMYESLATQPRGQSFIHPFDTAKLQDFNLWYILISLFIGVYNYMSWQGSQGFNSSALTPHEARMGKVIATWRTFTQNMFITLLALAALTFMRHPAFAEGAAHTNQALAAIGNPALQKQMTVPVALAQALPHGIKGLFAAVMIFLMITTDCSYMHSWGSIFIQDVVLPLRKRPFTQRQQIRLLRWSIVGVAIFAFFFSLLFRQTDYVFMFFSITGAIYCGGSGAVIIGGFYWKRGTTPGAWASMLVGAFLAVGGILLQQVWPALVPTLQRLWPGQTWLAQYADRFPINGQYLTMIAIAAAIVTYVVLSLLTCRRPFNMDWLLHRGKYAVRDDAMPVASSEYSISNWKKMFLGFDEHFTRGDKFLAGSVFGWSMFWFVVWIVVTLWNLVSPWPVRAFWYYLLLTAVFLPLVLAPFTTIWFTIGGLRDLTRLFRRLSDPTRELDDDGTESEEEKARAAQEVPALETAATEPPSAAAVAERPVE